MRGYAALYTFQEEEQRLLERASVIVAAFPEQMTHTKMGRHAWVRCHEAARAVGQILSLEVQDGRYGAVEHSWCRITRDGGDARSLFVTTYSLLDVYAVGQLPIVQLISNVAGLREYTLGKPRNDIDDKVVAALVKQGRAALEVEAQIVAERAAELRRVAVGGVAALGVIARGAAKKSRARRKGP